MVIGYCLGMGRAARLARSGQGFRVVRSEAAGAKISRGANRGRPLDIARDAREGDFIPLGPAAARKIPKPRTIDVPAGEVERREPGLSRRSTSDGTFVIGGKGRPEGAILMPPPKQFEREETVQARTSLKEPAQPKDIAGITIGNQKGAGPSGSLDREPKFKS